jgi:hypothetical protein
MEVIICLIIVVLVIAGVWRTFSKAGQPGWAAIIPIYNTYVLTEVGGSGILWFILMLVPFVNIIAAFKVCIDVAKKFGKGTGFGVCLALFGFVCFPILGFGSATYQGAPAAPVAPTAPASPTGEA